MKKKLLFFYFFYSISLNAISLSDLSYDSIIKSFSNLFSYLLSNNNVKFKTTLIIGGTTGIATLLIGIYFWLRKPKNVTDNEKRKSPELKKILCKFSPDEDYQPSNMVQMLSSPYYYLLITYPPRKGYKLLYQRQDNDRKDNDLLYVFTEYIWSNDPLIMPIRLETISKKEVKKYQ